MQRKPATEGPENAPPPPGVREETRRIRRLQRVVAFVQQLIGAEDTTRGEALRLMEETRRLALELFPDKGREYDLIYGPRLLRVYQARFESVVAGGRGGDG
jgi:hypothetical protein